MSTSWRKWGAALALVTTGAVTEARQGALGEVVDLVEHAGVSSVPGGTFAVGPDYLARFADGAVEFAPARGPEAAGDGRLTLALEAVERGGEPLATGGPVAAEVAGDVVRLRRGNGVVERYEARLDGVYQSLVLSERPVGHGDLVARFAVASELEPVARDGGIDFLASDGSGVRVGSVVGVDATGRRTEGRAQVVDGALELSLPAAFVDRATYPLVLDPLLGSIVDLTASIFGTPPDTKPDVAYDVDADEYLVAWQRQNDALNSVILARRVDGTTGAGLGSILVVHSAAGAQATEPAVASVETRDRFVVVWQEVPAFGVPAEVAAATVDAGTGSVGVRVVVAAGLAGTDQLTPDVGGQRDAGSDDVVVVWDEDGIGVRARAVDVPAVGAPSPFGATTTLVAQDLLSDPYAPAIAQSSGDHGRFLVTWTRTSFPVAVVEGRALDRFGVPLGASNVQISPASEPFDSGVSDVDGDGESWAVVWESFQGAGSAGYDEVTVQRVNWTGSGYAFDTAAAVASSNDTGASPIPRYAYCGDDLGVFLDRFRGGSFDFPQVGQLYQPWAAGCITQGVFFASGATVGLDVASTWSGGGDELDQTVLLAWDRVALGGSDARIEVQRYRTTGNGVDLGGGCGNLGELQLPCAYSGITTFRPRMRDTTPGGQGVLAFNTIATNGFACGPCTLIPAIDAGLQFVPTGLIDSSGSHSVALPIPPNTAGITVTFQWISVNPAPPGLCPNFPAVSLSNARAVTILPFP